MSDTTSAHYYKIKYNQAVERLRQSMIDSLSCSYKDILTTLDELQSYAYDMVANATLLMKLVEIHSDVRFDNFQEACRDGWTMVLMPEVVDAFESLDKDAEVYVLVFDEKNNLMGTLVRKDLSF